MRRAAVAPIRRLWSAVFLGYLALGATLQELPTYVTDRFHGNFLVVGSVVGAAFVGTAIARPFAGRAGDRGKTRSVAIGGATLAAFAALGHALAPDLVWLVIARVAMGVGEAGLFSATLPWVLKTADGSRTGRLAGWFGLSMWGGLSVGPLLAVGATWVGGSPAVWSTVILLPAAAAVLLISTRSGPATDSGERPSGWRDLFPKGSATPGVVLGLSAYGYGTLTALLVLFLGTHGVGGRAVGLPIFSAAFLLTRALGSPLVDKLGGVRIACWVLPIEAGGLAGISVAGNQLTALVATGVCGIGLGLIYPATSRITLSHTLDSNRGAGMGTMTSFWDIGILVAGPLSGGLGTWMGLRAAFAVSAAVALCAYAVIAAYRSEGVRPGRRSVDQPATEES